QTPLVQSLLATHAFPGSQPLQAPPPQSWSVSSPFFLLSVQLGATHVPQVLPPGQVVSSEQTSLAQSSLLVQPVLVGQSSPLPPFMPFKPPVKVLLVTVVVIGTLPTPPLVLLVSVMVLPEPHELGGQVPVALMLRPEPRMAWQMRQVIALWPA